MEETTKAFVTPIPKLFEIKTIPSLKGDKSRSDFEVTDRYGNKRVYSSEELLLYFKPADEVANKLLRGEGLV